MRSTLLSVLALVFALGYVRYSSSPRRPMDRCAWAGFRSPELSTVCPDRTLSIGYGLAEYRSRIYPSYFSALSQTIGDDTVTVCLVATHNRLGALETWADTYDGPLSVVYAMLPNDTLTDLRALLQRSKRLQRLASIHVAVSEFPRQLNAWRNLARALAVTDLVMMVDVDLVLRGMGGERVTLEAESEALRRLEAAEEDKSHVAIAVPAFEWTDERGEKPSLWVRDKKTLRQLYDAKALRPFHEVDCDVCHLFTNYARYFEDSNRTYRLQPIMFGFEPYIIHRRYGPPSCDEIYAGHAGDRQSCLDNMLLSGMEVYATRNKFLIHRDHPSVGYSRVERALNGYHYSQHYHETACFRHISRIARAGEMFEELPASLMLCTHYPKLMEHLADCSEMAEDLGKEMHGH